jgi:hypothetical protein
MRTNFEKKFDAAGDRKKPQEQKNLCHQRRADFKRSLCEQSLCKVVLRVFPTSDRHPHGVSILSFPPAHKSVGIFRAKIKQGISGHKPSEGFSPKSNAI